MMPDSFIMRYTAVFSCVLAISPGVPAAQGRTSTAVSYEIEYATYLGGSGDEQLREVIPCDDGSVLVGGQTNSADLPVTDAVVQTEYGGEPRGTGHPGIFGGDCFLARLSADGKQILDCTYFGGSKQERNVYGMALDQQGNIVITTTTRSLDIPTTEGAFQQKHAGGAADWVVAKLSPDCRQVLWCTYIGGSGDDSPRGGLAVDEHDNIYVVGGTNSPDFPTTSGVFQTERKGTRDAALVKLKPDGSGLVFATLLGGTGWDGAMGVTVDAVGNVQVAGHTRSADFPISSDAPQTTLGGKSDCYLAGFSPDARRLLYATYLGGRENEFAEHKLLLSQQDDIFLTGVTASPDFPTTPDAVQRDLRGQTDGFLTKLSRDRRTLNFSTLLGGSAGEFYLMPTLDRQGNIVVVGHTTSPDYQASAGAVQKEYGGGAGDGAIAVFKSDGTALAYASYLGGSGNDLIRSLAIGPEGEIYLVGNTTSRDFPVTEGAAQSKLRGISDAFIVKLVPTGQ
ncbi:MAG: SBBP repeat-containing protein [Planctomycetota bacterium]|jgi:hypothetical protein